ncbi:hypothetical protein ACFQ0X_37920 [Streptomyces rectiviolaceus]|uniref:hypothetical protein n=1 Tax=Streptomyces rectiviolaceus TaxID=332591 RepID=UPI003625CC14
MREIASVEDKSVDDVLSSMEPKDLSRRTGIPHKAVDKAIEDLRQEELRQEQLRRGE